MFIGFVPPRAHYTRFHHLSTWSDFQGQLYTPRATVFDVGAHTGFYTLLASHLVGPQGRVVAFEPLPHNVDYLRRHLLLNHVTNVTVFDLAVSDRCGVTSFQTGNSTYTGHLSTNGQMEVNVTSLDTLIAEGQVMIPQIVKIDVEGAEEQVLIGAQSLLTQHRPTIFLATHSSDLHQRCCAFLTAVGYQLQAIVGSDVDTTSEVLALPFHEAQ